MGILEEPTAVRQLRAIQRYPVIERPPHPTPLTRNIGPSLQGHRRRGGFQRIDLEMIGRRIVEGDAGAIERGDVPDLSRNRFEQVVTIEIRHERVRDLQQHSVLLGGTVRAVVRSVCFHGLNL